MKNSIFDNFNESAQDVLDFARCQRANGTFYGTSGRCVSGANAGDKEKAAPKSKADKASKKEEANRARSQKQKQTAGRTKAFKSELEKRKAEMKGASPEKVNALIAEASKAADRTEQLRQINTQEGRGGGAGRAPSPKAQTASEVKGKRAEVRELDKVAKAADKKAEAADKAWRKAGMPKGDQQKEVRRLDKEAKAANKEAEKADKAFQKANKAAKSTAKPKESPEEKAAKQLKSAKSKLQMEAKGLKQMRDSGISDSRISAASARVRSAKQKLETLRDRAAKKSGTSRPAKSSMTTRIAREERDIRRQAGAGSAKAKQYTDLKKRIQEGKVEDPISARRQLSSLRSELKPASPNQ